mgnify:CR=1 FL=1
MAHREDQGPRAKGNAIREGVKKRAEAAAQEAMQKAATQPSAEELAAQKQEQQQRAQELRINEEFRSQPKQVRDAINATALEHEVAPNDLFKAAQQEHQVALQYHSDWEGVLQDARRGSGMHLGTTRNVEQSGRDHSTVPGWDQVVDELANNNPHLDWGDDPADTLWQKLREGRQKKPGLNDEKTLSRAVDYLWEQKQNGGATNEVVPAAVPEDPDYDPDDPDSVPFSRLHDLSAVVERYVRPYVLSS